MTKKKDKRLSILLILPLALILVMSVFSISAYAESNEPKPPNEETGTTASDTAAVSAETPEAATAATAPEIVQVPPPVEAGNLSLVGDMTEGKIQYITVVSRAGNYFYIIIDRNADSENVYFLNMVDEADLATVTKEQNGASSIIPIEKDKKPEEEKPETELTETKEEIPKEEPDNSPLERVITLSALLIIAIGAAIYFFKFRRKSGTKKDTDIISELEGFDIFDDEEETVIKPPEEENDKYAILDEIIGEKIGEEEK